MIKVSSLVKALLIILMVAWFVFSYPTNYENVSHQATDSPFPQTPGRGFRGYITAQITGPGDSTTINFYFEDIYFFFMNPIMGAEYRTYKAWVTGSGTSQCTWRSRYNDFHYNASFGGTVAHDGSIRPALHLFLREHPGDQDKYLYYLNTSFTGKIPGHAYYYSIRLKGGSKGEGRIDCSVSPGNVELGEHVFREFERNAKSYSGCGGYSSGGGLFGVSIHDLSPFEVHKDEKCIQGQQVYDVEFNIQDKYKPDRTSKCPAQVSLEWAFFLEEVVVELEKCQSKWRPQHDKDPVEITARIVKPENVEGIFRFTLYEQSNEPGYCMNAGESEDADLNFIYFPAEFKEPEFIDVGKEVPEERMQTKNPTDNATVMILPQDYGAYAKLKAEVNLCGIWFPATVKGGTQEYVDIPRDDNGNHIADNTDWDMDGYSAKSDEDNIPLGKLGDGLSLYEEYRGFECKGEWKATDPNVKDLFVCFASDRLYGGLFEEASGVRIHEIDEKEFNGWNSRIVNFKNKTAHIVDQHGIYAFYLDFSKLDLDADGEPDLDVDGTTLPLREPIRSPGDVVFVVIDKNVDNMEKAVAHELGHCVGIDHHGDGNQDLTKDELRQMLNPEDPTGVLAALEKITDRDKFKLAVWQGENSGDSGCFMRFPPADFYQRDDGQIYLYPSDDSLGSSLCTSAAGTGYNKNEYREEVYTFTGADGTLKFLTRVFPMCGDAVRGSCKHRICVTDKRD